MFISIVIVALILLEPFAVETKENDNTTIIDVKLNDRVLLTCNATLETNFIQSNDSIANASSVLAVDLGWRLNLFKKDGILLKLHTVQYDLLIGNETDQGLYECGYYYLDGYASLNYKLLEKWLVKIVAKRTNNQQNTDNFLVIRQNNDSSEIDGESATFEIKTNDLNQLKKSVLVYWSIGLTVLVIVTVLIYFIRKYGLRNDGTTNDDIKKSPITEDPELLAKLNATSVSSKPPK